MGPEHVHEAISTATSIDTGTAILLVAQILQATVLLAGIPWAFGVQGKLATMKTLLEVDSKRRANSDREHTKFDGRLKSLEINYASCAVCSHGVGACQTKESVGA